MSEARSIWSCERCNAYHVGGLDLHWTEDDKGVRAICGATAPLEESSTELWQTWMVAEDPHPGMWGE